MSIFYQKNSQRIRLFTSKDNSYTAHLHSQIELLIVLEGELAITIDHVTYPLVSGDVVIVFPNQLHSLNTHEHSRILLCIFDMDFCHSYQKYFQKCNPKCNYIAGNQLSEHSLLAVTGLTRLSETFPRGAHTPQSVVSLSEGYLTLLLADLFPHLELKPKNISADLVLEQRLLMYIDAHYTEDLSLEILAREFGVSRFILSRLFSEKFHTTFPCYVNSKRLDYARELLADTSLSITQIAMDSGFGSSRTFFREFQQTFNLTPKEYRQSHIHTEAPPQL